VAKTAPRAKGQNPYLTNYGKKSINNIQDLDLLAKCGCIMCTTSVYRQTADFLVCSVCQKLANVLSYPIQEPKHPN
jgi:hypothetical protein